MARPAVTPDKNTLERYLEEGLTHQQIADIVNRQHGSRIGRTAIAAAVMKYGLGTPRPRYEDELPWKVKDEHGNAYQAVMLRLLGRKRHKRKMSAKEEDALDSWLEGLKKNSCIVGYDPDSGPGFFYINKRYKDHNRHIPIRVKPLRNM